METFNFGTAIALMESGSRVARKGWNGRGIFIGLVPAFDIENEAEKAHDKWMDSKRSQGIESRLSESGEEFMVPYSHLSEPAKQLDRDQVTGEGIMTGAYIYIDTTGLQTNNTDAPKSRVPWLASQTDMLANDWVNVESEDE